MEANSLVIECKKLKSFEEQIWLKKNLSFIPDNYRSDVVKLLSEMNSGNLVAQQNEIELLKLLYLDSNQDKKDLSDITNHMINSAEFSPFELEDAILQGQTKKALEIVKSLRKADSYSGPLLIWIMGKITSLASLASRDNSPQIYLKDNGVWQSKINDYLSFMKNQTKEDLELMQKSIYDLELSLKGLIKKDFWIELESLICKLGPN
jgi:DNA polymerase-3 subunit delta